MQRKVVLTLALVLGLATYAQAALSIVVGQHNYLQGTGVVRIPITITGTDLVHGTDLSVQLGGSAAAVAPFGSAPPITYEGSEQYNNPTPGGGATVIGQGGPGGGVAPANAVVVWDIHANSWGDSTSGSFDDVPSIPGSQTSDGRNYGDPTFEGTWFTGSTTFNASAGANATTNPNNKLEVNLVVDLTGFGPGTWSLLLLGGKAGATDFVNLAGGVIPTTIVDGAITIVPEPTSVVLGLFAAAGLGLVAIRKRRARRS